MPSVLQFRLLDFESAPWEELDRFEDRNVFQTRQWIEFLCATQSATPVLAELREETRTLGFFTGLIFRKMGMRILGSSFPGWTTPYIGFNLHSKLPRPEALRALEKFAFDELRCMHFEICDRLLSSAQVNTREFLCDYYQSYETDLTASEEQLFNQMDSACRRCIRKAEKSGVRIEQANDRDFATEYYKQLQDVFAKQNLVPTYDLKRVQKLIDCLLPSGNLLLLRARDSQGNCIGTGIYPGFNKIASFWGNASFRSSQHLRPNELLHWSAMRHWKRRGIAVFDWGGGGSYKEKYGVKPISIPWIRKSRYAFVEHLRSGGKAIFAAKQQILGKLKRDTQQSLPADKSERVSQ